MPEPLTYLREKADLSMVVELVQTDPSPGQA